VSDRSAGAPGPVAASTGPLPTVLVVEDEPEFAALLALWIEDRGWRTILAADGADALVRFDRERPDVVLLDVSLPGLDGWHVLERIRAAGETPVLMVTARGEVTDRLRGLGHGADDYITKPFSFPELIARIEVALRHAARASGTAPAAIHIGDLVIDPAAHRVRVGGREVHLTPTEFRLLLHLAERRGLAVTHRELLFTGWGRGYERDLHILQVTIRNLRSRLDPDDRSRHVHTVYGVGYRLA